MPTTAPTAAPAIAPDEAIIRITTVSEGESGCVVAATSAPSIAASLAEDAPHIPGVLEVAIVAADGTVTQVYPAPSDDTCWADPLNREERRKLAKILAGACGSFFQASQVPGKGRRSLFALTEASAEMSDLHLDVTERAEVAR